MADTTRQVNISGDMSQVTQSFADLIQKINSASAEIKQLQKNGKNTTTAYQALNDALEQLNVAIERNNGEVDASNISYKELSRSLSVAKDAAKSANTELGRTPLAKTANAINVELKKMDSQMGIYSRNVGNYENSISSAMQGVQMATSQIVRELPSLGNGIQTFFMAISNNLPILMDAINRYKEVINTSEAASTTVEESVAAHMAEANAVIQAADAKQAESAANTQGAASHLAEIETTEGGLAAKEKELQITIADTKAKIENIKARQNNATAVIKEALDEQKNAQTQEELTIALRKRAVETNNLKKVEKELAAAEKELAMQEGQLKTIQDLLGKSADAAAKKTIGFGASMKILIKSFANWQTVILIGITMLTMYGKEIGNFISKLFKGNTLLKDFNDTMLKSTEKVGDNIAKLELYSAWALKDSVAQKERVIAAKEVLKILGETVNETNIAKVMNNEYKDSITAVTEALLMQAQAQASLDLISEKYKDYLKTYEKESKKMGTQTLSTFFSVGKYDSEGMIDWDRALENADKIRQKRIEDAKAEYEEYKNMMLELFNPSDLLGFSNSSGSTNGNSWFNIYELQIKALESKMIKFQGTYESLDYSSIWKYSAEGLELYMKMYDENAKHYAKDKKAFEQNEAAKLKYLGDYQNYHAKLKKQFEDSTKTDYEVETNKLEEWYKVQMEIYTQAGEDTTSLVAEYEKRKADIQKKYSDEYINTALSGKELELKELKDDFDDQIAEYERKGIATVNLTEEYNKKVLEINSKYAEQDLRNTLENIKRQQELSMKYNALNSSNAIFGKNRNTELGYAKMGGTTVTNRALRKADMATTTSEKSIFEASQMAQIQALQSVLDSKQLTSEAELEIRQQLAQAEQELALGTAEYEMMLNQMVLEDTKLSVQERMDVLRDGFNGLKNVFDDVYDAIQYNIEAQVKAGKISEEQGEKQLENFRGIKAASAAMDAMASAVGAYQSLASIPYVGPALGAIAAAAALTSGFMQVKNILAVSKDSPMSSLSDSYSPALADFNPSYTTNITNKTEQTDLANALNKGLQGANFYVNVTDINKVQNKVNVRDSNTSF